MLCTGIVFNSSETLTNAITCKLSLQWARSCVALTLHHVHRHFHSPVLRCVTSLLGPRVIVYIMWTPARSKIICSSVLKSVFLNIWFKHGLLTLQLPALFPPLLTQPRLGKIVTYLILFPRSAAPESVWNLQDPRFHCVFFNTHPGAPPDQQV